MDRSLDANRAALTPPKSGGVTPPKSGGVDPPPAAVRARRLPAAWQTLGLWLLPLAFLAVFFFLPLGGILRVAAAGLLEQGLSAAGLTRLTRALGFTFYQAGLSTLLTVLVGLPAAYVFARFTFPGKGALRLLSSLPFILPTVVVAAAFNSLIGPRGWLNLLAMNLFDLSAPPLNLLNSLPAILLAHVFYNTTIVLRVVGSAWEQLDPRLEQAARVLGASPWRAFREVTLPLLRPSLLAAALLVFLFNFTSFGVILLLGGARYATLEVEIYIQALHLLNLPLAGLLSLVQLLCTLLMTGLYTRITARLNIPLNPRLRGEGASAARTLRQKALVAATALLLFCLLVLPLAALAGRSLARLEPDRGQRGGFQAGLTLDYYRELFINRRGALFYVPPIEAARNSLLYAGVTVAVSLGLGLPASAALSRRAPLNRVLDPLLMLPLGASAVTLGLGFILVFNRPPLEARSFPLLLPLAHSLVALPFVVRTLTPALLSIPHGLRQAAAVLGASPLRVWLEIDLPIIARAALVAAVFSFTISLGEFGATSFLARPEFPTLPVAIFRFISQPGGLNYGQALAMSTLLLAVCALGIALIERIQWLDLDRFGKKPSI